MNQCDECLRTIDSIRESSDSIQREVDKNNETIQKLRRLVQRLINEQSQPKKLHPNEKVYKDKFERLTFDYEIEQARVKNLLANDNDGSSSSSNSNNDKNRTPTGLPPPHLKQKQTKQINDKINQLSLGDIQRIKSKFKTNEAVQSLIAIHDQVQQKNQELSSNKKALLQRVSDLKIKLDPDNTHDYSDQNLLAKLASIHTGNFKEKKVQLLNQKQDLSDRVEALQRDLNELLSIQSTELNDDEKVNALDIQQYIEAQRTQFDLKLKEKEAQLCKTYSTKGYHDTRKIALQLEKCNNQKKNNLKLYNLQKKNFQKELDALTKDAARYKKELNDIQRCSEVKRSDDEILIDNLQHSIDSQQLYLNKVKAQLISDHEDNSAESKVNSALSELGKCQYKVRQLEAKIQDKQIEQNEQEKHAGKYKKEIADLKSKLQKIKKDKKESDEQLQSLENEIQTHTSIKDQLETDKKNQLSASLSTQQKIEELQKQVTLQQEKLQKCTEKKIEHEATINQLNIEISEKKNKLANQKKSIKELKKSIRNKVSSLREQLRQEKMRTRNDFLYFNFMMILLCKNSSYNRTKINNLLKKEILEKEHTGRRQRELKRILEGLSDDDSYFSFLKELIEFNHYNRHDNKEKIESFLQNFGKLFKDNIIITDNDVNKTLYIIRKEHVDKKKDGDYFDNLRHKIRVWLFQLTEESPLIFSMFLKLSKKYYFPNDYKTMANNLNELWHNIVNDNKQDALHNLEQISRSKQFGGIYHNVDESEKWRNLKFNYETVHNYWFGYYLVLR